MSSTCYMCTATPTSREHVPPKCFFPDQLIGGIDLRQNLLTVPSCDAHNSAKSEDDEFFRAMVVFATEHVSSVASSHFGAKVLRAAKRSHSKYSTFVRAAKRGSGRAALQFDRSRFDRCIDHCARALYYNHFGSRWPYPIRTVSPHIYLDGPGESVLVPGDVQAIVDTTKGFVEYESVRGDNPAVFRYRIRAEANDALAIVAQFYEHFEVCAYSFADCGDARA